MLSRKRMTIQPGFTLTELIVVITILAILATIAFISFQSYAITSRDTVRMSAIKNIHKGLQVQSAKAGTFPTPDSPIVIAGIGQQGYAGDSIQRLININGAWKDPVDDSYYMYNIDSNLQKAQISGFLEENNSTVFSLSDPLFDDTYAASNDYTNRYVFTVGDTIGVLLDSGTKAPINAVLAATGIDLNTDTGSYTAVFSNAISSSGTTVSGSGVNLLSQISKAINDSSPFICGKSTVSAGGYKYTTILGPDGKCWTSQNMSHGIMLAAGATMPSNTNSLEKWCYNNSPANCTTYGGLYTWQEAMGLANDDTTSTTEDTTRSICGFLGSGWALPSDAQWTALTNSGATGWTGNKLGGIISVLGGNRQLNGSYLYANTGGYWRSSTSFDGPTAWRRYLSNAGVIGRNHDDKAFGFSIVCIKN